MTKKHDDELLTYIDIACCDCIERINEIKELARKEDTELIAAKSLFDLSKFIKMKTKELTSECEKMSCNEKKAIARQMINQVLDLGKKVSNDILDIKPESNSEIIRRLLDEFNSLISVSQISEHLLIRNKGRDANLNNRFVVKELSKKANDILEQLYDLKKSIDNDEVLEQAQRAAKLIRRSMDFISTSILGYEVHYLYYEKTEEIIENVDSMYKECNKIWEDMHSGNSMYDSEYVITRINLLEGRLVTINNIKMTTPFTEVFDFCIEKAEQIHHLRKSMVNNFIGSYVSFGNNCNGDTETKEENNIDDQKECESDVRIREKIEHELNYCNSLRDGVLSGSIDSTQIPFILDRVEKSMLVVEEAREKRTDKSVYSDNSLDNLKSYFVKIKEKILTRHPSFAYKSSVDKDEEIKNTLMILRADYKSEYCRWITGVRNGKLMPEKDYFSKTITSLTERTSYFIEEVRNVSKNYSEPHDLFHLANSIIYMIKCEHKELISLILGV